MDYENDRTSVTNRTTHYENDRASNAGSLVGIIAAALFAIALFGGYTLFISENAAPQSSAANTQQINPNNNAPSTSPQTAPPAAQTAPNGNPPRDGESTSQNAN